MTLSVIVPFYNEENTLEESINRLIRVDMFEKLYLVNDCSTDNSLKIAKKLASENNSIILSSTYKNLGKGGALETLTGKIDSTHVVIHDADLEYFPEDLIDLYNKAQKYPDALILGSRFIGTKKRKNLYLRTYFANKFLSLVFSLIYFKKISDVATCYKLMPTAFFNSVNFIEKGFAIEIELIAKYLKFNKTVIEVPIKYDARSYEEGKKIKPIDGLNYIISSLRYRF